MSKVSPYDWSTTASSNTDLGSIDTSGSGLLSTTDDIVREMMAEQARWLDSIGGVNTVGGTASVITVTIGEDWSAYATGQVLAVKAGSATTGATTLNVTPKSGSALGAKAIRRQGDSALLVNDMVANGIYLLRYDAAYNSAAGAWVLMNQSLAAGGTVTGNLTIAESSAALFISSNAGNSNVIEGDVGGLTRWRIYLGDASTESGTRTGSDFKLTSTSNDGGTTIDALKVARADGTLTLTGPLVLTASGGQIAFPATQSASSDANTLDDYEEGTWTPVLTFATPGNLSVSYSVQTGYYTKIGRKVTVHCTIVTSAFTFTTATGLLNITGLPFTVTNAGRAAIQFQGITKAGYGTVVGQAVAGGTLMNFTASGSGVNQSPISASDMPTAGSVTLAFSIQYDAA